MSRIIDLHVSVNSCDGEMMGSVEIGVQDDGHMITVPLVGVDTTVMNLRRGGGTDPLSAIVEEMEI